MIFSAIAGRQIGGLLVDLGQGRAAWRLRFPWWRVPWPPRLPAGLACGCWWRSSRRRSAALSRMSRTFCSASASRASYCSERLLGLDAGGFGVGDVLADAFLAGLEAGQHVLPGGLVENECHDEEDAPGPRAAEPRFEVDQVAVGETGILASMIACDLRRKSRRRRFGPAAAVLQTVCEHESQE